MLKKYFLIALPFCIKVCFSMDYDTQRRLLAIDAKPIHEALSLELDKKDIPLNTHQLMSRFIKSFKDLDVDASILFHLPDQRDLKEYAYLPSQNQEYKIEYYDPNQVFDYWHNTQTKQSTIIRHDAQENVVRGIPITVELTENGKKNRIKLIDTDTLVHAGTQGRWPYDIYKSKRTYNLIRLLFDCNRAEEVESLLNSSNKMLKLSFPSMTLESFEKMYARLRSVQNNNVQNENIDDVLLKLRKKLVIDYSDFNRCADCCNCCLSTTQLVCLLGCLFYKADKVRPFLRPAMLTVLSCEAIKKKDKLAKLIFSKEKKD